MTNLILLGLILLPILLMCWMHIVMMVAHITFAPRGTSRAVPSARADRLADKSNSL